MAFSIELTLAFSAGLPEVVSAGPEHIGRTSTFSRAALPSGFRSDVKTENESQGHQKPWLSFFVALIGLLLVQPRLEYRLVFLAVIILADFEKQMPCKGINDRLRQFSVKLRGDGGDGI
ncbi:MAG: hypothetical protein ACI3XJ_13520 [Oscillospiraceae bacterium]